MQTSTPAWKKLAIPVVGIVAVIVIVVLSNKPAVDPNGVPVVYNEDTYRNLADEAAKLADDGVKTFNRGDELSEAQKRKLEKAAKDFDGMDRYLPTASAGYFEAGFCYYLIGSTDQALERVNQALKNSEMKAKDISPKDEENLRGVIGDCHHLLSLIAFDRHDYQKALDESNEALKIKTDRPLYYVARANAEVQLNLNDAARLDLAQALRIYPKFPPATKLLGFINHK